MRTAAARWAVAAASPDGAGPSTSPRIAPSIAFRSASGDSHAAWTVQNGAPAGTPGSAAGSSAGTAAMRAARSEPSFATRETAKARPFVGSNQTSTS